MLSRKHFVYLAKEFRRIRPTTVKGLKAWSDCLSVIICLCQQSNPNFDKRKFVEKCNE